MSTLYRMIANAIEYADGVTADETPIDAARLAAITANGKRKVRNLRKPNADEAKQGFAAVLVNHKARPRRVIVIGQGERIIERASGAVATDLRRVGMSAKRAASLAGLTPAETAAFVARFPADGSAAPLPKDVELVATAFRKVNGLGKAGAVLAWSESAKSAEVLA